MLVTCLLVGAFMPEGLKRAWWLVHSYPRVCNEPGGWCTHARGFVTSLVVGAFMPRLETSLAVGAFMPRFVTSLVVGEFIPRLETCLAVGAFMPRLETAWWLVHSCPGLKRA